LSSNHQQHIDMVFSSRHGTVSTQGKDLEAAQDDSNFASRETVDLVDLEAARDDSNFASREKVDVVGLDNAEPGNSKESIPEKAAV